VSLVDINEAPIHRFTERGLLAGETEHEFDVVIMATGFDAMTGALNAITVHNGETSLQEKWADGPRTYLGLMSADFPNLFTITGPQSPSVLSNMPVSIEQHVEWITGCIDAMRKNGKATIEATRQAQDEWVAHVEELTTPTLYPAADSWYIGANVPGKPRVFMPYIGGLPRYTEAIEEVAADDYRAFTRRMGASNAYRLMMIHPEDIWSELEQRLHDVQRTDGVGYSFHRCVKGGP
jgi:cyclohexanone monooxygenase